MPMYNFPRNPAKRCPDNKTVNACSQYCVEIWWLRKRLGWSKSQYSFASPAGSLFRDLKFRYIFFSLYIPVRDLAQLVFFRYGICQNAIITCKDSDGKRRVHTVTSTTSIQGLVNTVDCRKLTDTELI